MSKELSGVEFTFANIIEEKVLIAAFSDFLGVDSSTIWDWEWAGEAPATVYADVRLALKDEPKYPFLVSLLFTDYLVAEPAFELKFGYALAQRFACPVLINDETGDSEDFLEITPAGMVAWCSYEEDEREQRVLHYWPGPPTTYQEAVNQIEERARAAV